MGEGYLAEDTKLQRSLMLLNWVASKTRGRAA